MGESNSLFRIRIISFFILGFFLVLVVSLYFIQIVNGDDFSIKADKQYLRPSENIFDRGSIFFQDKNGINVSAATLKLGFILAINPKLIDSSKEQEIYEKLSKLVEINESDYFKKVAKKTDPYEEISQHLTSEVVQKITELKLIGVNVYKERWRFYPGNNLASNMIGFIGFQGNDLAGRYGIRKYFISQRQKCLC